MKIYILVKSWEQSDGEGDNDILIISTNYDEVRKEMEEDYTLCIDNSYWIVDQDVTFCSGNTARAIQDSGVRRCATRWNIYSWMLDN